VIPLRDENPTRRTAWLTIALILLNVGVYFLVQPGSTEVEATAVFNYKWAAIPCEVSTGEPLTIQEISQGDCSSGQSPYPEVFPDKHVFLAVLFSMFFHGSLLHLGGNMLFLWVFGNNIEDRLGRARFVLFYVLAGLAATFVHVFFQPTSTIPVVGASGAIAGVMGAYLVWFPNAQVLSFLFFVIARIRAKWWLLLWFASQFFVNPNEGVAWVAHVGGFVFGAMVALIGRQRRQLASA
jgi:membrane associated rhomboid family serine protease